MPFPVFPFLLGAVAGGTVTYVVMNKRVRQKIEDEDSASKVADTVKDTAKVPDQKAQPAVDNAEKPPATENDEHSASKVVDTVKDTVKVPDQKAQPAVDNAEKPPATENEKP